MNLIIYSPDTLTQQPQGNPFLTISPKGNFTLSRRACELLNLKPGSKLSLAQDKDSPKDWYLLPNATEGYIVRGKKATGENLTFTAIRLAATIYKSWNVVPDTVRLPVVAEPQEVNGQQVYTLITAALRKLPLAPVLKVG